MAYYEMMPAGLPAGLQSGMDSVLNKKFGTATSYAPGTWPDTVNLMGPLPEATATGSIAHITDGADEVPLKSWEVEIDANLSGVSSVVCTQMGKNFYPISIGADRFTNNGSASHSNDNGTLVIVTSTGSASGVYINTSDTLCEVRNVLKWCYDRNIPKTISFDVVSSVDNVSMRVTSGTNTLFTVGTTKTRVSHVSTSNNFSVYTVNTPSTLRISNFQIEIGSIAHDYEPYTAPTVSTVNLGRTIYGGTADVVKGTGTATIDENGDPIDPPETFTFTPITPTPETALGVNNFWADEGDSEVTYRADINLALQALSGSRGLMMARPQLEPETEPEETIEETPEEMER